jgi:hypothetical protein
MLLTPEERERLMREEGFLKLIEDLERLHSKYIQNLIRTGHTELADVAYEQGRILAIEDILTKIGKPIIK